MIKPRANERNPTKAKERLVLAVINSKLFKKPMLWSNAVNGRIHGYEQAYKSVEDAIRYGLLGTAASIALIVISSETAKMAGLGLVATLIFGSLPIAKLKRAYEEYSADLNRGLESLMQEMALIISTGLSIQDAYSLIAKQKSKLGVMNRLYEHIDEECAKGKTLFTGLASFALLYKNRYLNKLNAILAQSAKSGSCRLSENLKSLSTDMMLERRADLKRRAETLSTKLLMPLMLSLIGIMAMLMVPVFMQLGF